LKMNPKRYPKNPVRLTALVLVVAALILAACSPAATAAPTNTAAPINTAVPAPTETLAPKAGSGQAVSQTINIANSSTYGHFLVDSKGMTLYIFTKDAPNKSNCTGGCTTVWPPLLTSGKPAAGSGVDDSKLGSITLADNTLQVTYNQMALYYFAKDKAAGDTFGQNVGSVWFMVAPDGSAISTASAGTSTSPAPTSSYATAATSSPAAAAGATLNAANTYALGNYLVDAKGMTLYIYTKDTAGVSNCSGGCAANWPPLLTTSTPSAGKGVDDSKLGTITRADGSKQVTYNNQPLYYYIGDNNPGDTSGQGIGNVWYVLAPKS
jgi:predicted lipoprotein with Yx(FWY)xxD motif